MAEVQATTSSRVLTFVSGKANIAGLAQLVGISIVAALVIFYRRSVIFEPPGDAIGSVALLVLLWCMLILTIRVCWIIEVDPAARRLIIFRVLMLHRPKIVLRTTVVEDCSFDDCSEVGATHNGDSYSVYLDFKRGGTHLIPVEDGSLSEATKNAAELAAMTGIPKRTDPYPGYSFLGGNGPHHSGQP
jgi:hypothetical protein